MPKIRVNGKSYEVDDDVAKLFNEYMRRTNDDNKQSKIKIINLIKGLKAL